MASSVVVQVAGLRYALPMANVLRAVNAVEVTPFPVASKSFMGIIDIAGEVIPVVDFRHVLGHESCPVQTESSMVVVQTSRAKLVLPVDSVLGVDQLAETTHPDGTSLHANCVDAFLVDAEGLVFGIDVDRVVTDDDYATFGFLAQSVGGQ